MENHDTFQQGFLPYEKLQLIGINREMADNLPEEFKLRLSNGQVTPLVQVDIITSNESKVTLPLRLQLVPGSDKEAVLMAYPVKADISEKTANELQLTRYEVARLSVGEVVMKNLTVDWNNRLMYLQMDNETKSIIKSSPGALELEEKIKGLESINDIQLGQQQKQQIREGKPVELSVGGETVSVGVDLKEPDGFRIMKGDMREWDLQRQMKYDRDHPEFIGLVQTDRNRWEYQQVVDKQSTERTMSHNMDHQQRAGIKR